MFIVGNELVAIVTDSSCCLSDKQLASYDIRTVSHRILCSSGDYRDNLEFTASDLFSLSKRDIPRTTFPLPEDVSRCFRQLQQDGCTQVLFLTVSSLLSGTYGVASLSANDIVRIHVTVFDSASTGCGLGLLVLEAAECFSSGMSIEDTITRLKSIRYQQQSLCVVDFPNNLYRSHTLAPLSGFPRSFFRAKSLVEIAQDGAIRLLHQYQDMDAGISAISRSLTEHHQDRPLRLGIVYINAEHEANQLSAKLTEQLHIESCFLNQMDPALVIHTGNRAVGVSIQPID